MSVPRNEVDYSGNLDVDTKFNSAENVARMVFQFVSGANVFADAMDKSDEVKLLRLRTRKSEVVIVPGKSSI